MKQIRYIAGCLLLMGLAACTFDKAVSEPVANMVTGRWATVDGKMLVLIDLKESKFQIGNSGVRLS